jgi:V8-like Glu-specific endopeptidase
MGLYEIKKKYYDGLVVNYEKQYALLDEYQTIIILTTDPTAKAQNEYHINRLQTEIAKMEEQLSKAESDVQKYATTPEKIFNPPPKIYIGGPNQKLLPTASFSTDVEKVEFNPNTFGEVVVGEGELEALISSRAKYVEPVPFMNGLRRCIMGVGRVELKGEAFGTATLVAKNKILTNWHVVRDPKYLDSLTVRFGHYFSDEKTLEPGQVFKVTKLLAWKGIAKLDYALLEIEGDPTTESNFNVVAPSVVEPIEDRVVNILHHPAGQPMKLSTQDNWVKKVQGDRVLYLTGTEKGSSGAPVFNDKWELVALHHSGQPVPPSNFPGKIEANEGILMKFILDDLAKEGVQL